MPSTVIHWFRYDEATERLTIMFRSGRCYVYEGVPATLAARMKASFSKGQFFNEHIRDRFAFVRDENASADESL
ncbi:MAG: KTSC domain-containing protein [Povalibacter sp.]